MRNRLILMALLGTVFCPVPPHARAVELPPGDGGPPMMTSPAGFVGTAGPNSDATAPGTAVPTPRRPAAPEAACPGCPPPGQIPPQPAPDRR